MNKVLKTRDGKIFKLGDTVVFNSGREIATDPEKFEIIEVNGESCLQRKNGCASISLLFLYSSQEARITEQIKILKAKITDIEQEIKFIKDGGDPMRCEYLD